MQSAKDRTAMSLTLEESRLLCDLHHVTGQPVDLANIMREHGTRLINVNKVRLCFQVLLCKTP